MYFKEIFDIYKQAWRILQAKYKPTVVKHALGLSLLSIADFVGLAVLVPLLVVLLNSGLHNSIFGHYPVTYLFAFLAGVMLFFIVKAYVSFFLLKKQASLVSRIVRNISEINTRQFLDLPYEKRLETNSSLFSEKVYFQPLLIGQGIFVPLFVLFQESVVLICILCGLLVFYPFISLGLMIVLALSGIIMYKWIRSRTKVLGQSNISKRKNLFNEITLSHSGMLDIKQNQAQEFYIKDITDKVYTLAKGELETNTLKVIPFRVNELISVVGLAAMILYAYMIDFQEDFILFGSVFALALFRAVPAINRIQLNLVQMRLYSNHLKTLNINTSVEIESEVLAPFCKNLSVKAVSQTYRESNEPIFNPLNFTIPAGTITVFSGRSGAGKSTMLKIIAGQVTPSKGELWVDGVKITPNNIKSWQNQLTYISQKPFVHRGSILDNLTLGSDKAVDKKRAEEALVLSGLNEFVDGWETRAIGEEGFKISEGQKQRLLLARALYRNTRILLLDEITANLDSENTHYILRTLRAMRQRGCTIILISHNPDFFTIADLNINFKDKQIYLHEYSKSES